ncbi:SCO3242 family prenyltransferase [Streptomyces avermitilis]|uniref:SCO3242 family prenyltransferase n=1 Tax=Streptomyces avermitilis TaxID=33903 RepID=UPI0033A055DF
MSGRPHQSPLGSDPVSHRPPGNTPSRLQAWAELLRLPALFTVPGDALAGAAATGARPTPRTLLAICSSLCLYEAGMALNDWADRAEDAVERPHRPLPSGRVRPGAALAAAGALTAAGLALAARAGRPALTVAAPLAATVWAYDLTLKRTAAGPLAMATARGLDLLLGATATTGSPRRALPSALALSTHTLAVTAVSRRETQGGSSSAPLAALAVTGVLTGTLSHRPAHAPVSSNGAGTPPARANTAGTHPARANTAAGTAPIPGVRGTAEGTAPIRGARGTAAGTAPPPDARGTAAHTLHAALTAVYAATAARPLFHAVLNPSPPLTQRAVGAGIRAMIPLQAALAARSGAATTAVLTAALAPAARKFARRVSVT